MCMNVWMSDCWLKAWNWVSAEKTGCMGTTPQRKQVKPCCLLSTLSFLPSSYLEYPALFPLAFWQNLTHFSCPAQRLPPPGSLPRDNSLPQHYCFTLLYNYNLHDPISVSPVWDYGSQEMLDKCLLPWVGGKRPRAGLWGISHLVGEAETGRSYSASASLKDRQAWKRPPRLSRMFFLPIPPLHRTLILPYLPSPWSPTSLKSSNNVQCVPQEASMPNSHAAHTFTKLIHVGGYTSPPTTTLCGRHNWCYHLRFTDTETGSETRSLAQGLHQFIILWLITWYVYI